MVSVALFWWEFNVRASTVLGVVGAGGIGQELKNSMDLLLFPRLLARLHPPVEDIPILRGARKVRLIARRRPVRPEGLLNVRPRIGPHRKPHCRGPCSSRIVLLRQPRLLESLPSVNDLLGRPKPRVGHARKGSGVKTLAESPR